MKKFIGTGVAVITPFHANKEIDFSSFSKIIRHLIDGKVEYLVIQGTTGESSTVNLEEKFELVKIARKETQDKIPIVLGIGGNNTSSVINALKKADFTGISAILSVCPYYNKPRQEGIYQHFKAISEVCPVPIIVYNVPGRTVINMEIETTIKLAKDCDNIVAIKEATNDLDQIMKLIMNKPDNFIVIGGDDALALPFISLGTSGVISVIANAFPYEFSQMIRYALEGNFEEARKLHYRFCPLMQAMLPMGNPGAIKAIMHILGYCENVFRLPLVPIDVENYRKLENLIKNFLEWKN